MSVYSYTLPIEKYKEELLKVIEKNKTTIIKGPTGCGKSTFIPLLFKDKKMAIVEPRRIAVTSIYNTLSAHIPQIGYKMRFDKKIKPNTNVTIFTDGSFLNDIASLDYDYIIIDEVHERSERTDIILGVLRNDYKGRLILMSASLDTAKLEKYFSAKTYEIPGHGYPVNVKYLEKATNDYISESYFTIKNILSQRERLEKKDILVFLPGEEDINELYQLCRRIPSIEIYRIHSSMSDSDQQKIYDEHNLTKVILSTNICETSLTIPNIKYVVDTGLCKLKIYNGLNYLGIQGISAESAIQRMGRCNRLGPGVCYKLYREFEMLQRSVPAIVRSDLCAVVLSLINLQKNILTFEFLDFPPIKNCLGALEFLLLKNCIEIVYKKGKGCVLESFEKLLEASWKDEFVDYSIISRNIDIKITKYGRRLAFHPFDPPMAHFYEQCIEHGIGYHGSLLLALISQDNNNFMNNQGNNNSIKDLRNGKFGSKQEDDGCVNKQKDDGFVGKQQNKPDILYLKDLLFDYLECGNRQKFCQNNIVSFKGMEIACKMLKTLNKSNDGDSTKFEKIFSGCFSHNICDRMKDGSYTMRKNGLQVFIHPSSAFFRRNDRKIVVVDVFCSTKTYARVIGKYYE